MEPQDWEDRDPDEIPSIEFLKPFRNQSSMVHAIFLIIGVTLAIVSYIGFFFLTGTWEDAVVHAEQEQGDALMNLAAYIFTWLMLSIYMILGYFIPAGGPMLNFFAASISPIIANVSTGFMFSKTEWLLPIGLDLFPYGPLAIYGVIGVIIVLIPWTILIRHVSRLAKDDSETLREFEQRHMPAPIINWGE